MDKEKFRQLLQQSTKDCREFSKNFLRNQLDGTTMYLVIPNSSYDGNPLVDDEMVYPEDTLPEGKEHILMKEEAVAEYFWRDGRIPEWIDITPKKEKDGQLFFELKACGRFTSNKEALYYTHQNRGPFGVKGPILPSDWISLEESGKFWL